jgi:multisubunit Na+/H+ antiporter MnhF subunit
LTPNIVEWIAFLLMGIALLLGLVRLLRGPSAGDRIVAADTLGVVTTALIAGIAALMGTSLMLDIALIYGVLAFVGVVAIARAIEGSH